MRRAQDARGGRAAREAALRAEHTQLGEQAALLAAQIEVCERRPRVPRRMHWLGLFTALMGPAMPMRQPKKMLNCVGGFRMCSP